MYYIPPPEDISPDQLKIVCPDKEQCQKDLLWSWHETMLTYRKSFPGKYFVLALSEPIRSMPGVNGVDLAEKIVDDAMQIFGSKLCLQQDGLREKNKTARETMAEKGKRSWHSIMLARSGTAGLGFQTMMPTDFDSVFPVGAGTPPERLYIKNSDDMKQTFEVGLSYPIRYLEVWTSTLLDSRCRSMVDMLYKELEKR